MDRENRAAWQIFSRQYALARLLQSWGILPAAVLGFGIGHYAALAIAEVVSLQEVLLMIGQTKRDVAYRPAQIPVVSPHTLAIIDELKESEISTSSSGSLSLSDIQSHLQTWGVDDFLEVGYDRLGDKPLFSGGESNERQSIYSCLGWAFCRGFELNWQQIYCQQRRRRVPLPTYPFQKKPYWFMGNTKDQDDRKESRQPPDRDVPESQQVKQKVDSPEVDISDEAIARQVPILQAILAQTLSIDPEEIESDTHFGEYGMDSMLMKQAVILLEGHYKIPIQANILYEYPNLGALTAYFARLNSRQPEPAPSVEKKEAQSDRQRESKDPLMDILDRFLDDELSIGEAQKQILQSLK
jgi:acyl transferase domain-containing protein